MVSKRGFVLLALVSFACNWDFYAIIPSIFQRVVLANQGLGNCTSVNDVDLTASSGELYGWTIGAFPIAALIFSVVFGIANDKVGTRAATSIGMLLMAAGNAVFIVRGQTIPTAIAGRALTGAGSACRVACLAAISKAFQGPERGAKIGMWFAAGIVSMVMGPMVAASIATSSFWEISSETIVAFVSGTLELLIAVAIIACGITQDSSYQEAPLNVDDNEYGTNDEPSHVHHSHQVFEENESAVTATPKHLESSTGLPTGLKVLMFANFIFTLCITTFEATLVPMLQSRFKSSKTVQSLTFGGIGLCVFISSGLTRALEMKGLSKWGIIFAGAVIFMIGTVASVDFPVPQGASIAIEVISCIFCASGFTFAAVKIPDLFAGLIIAEGETLLPKMGQLMGLLSMGGSFARAIGPIALGYGLHLSINIIIIAIAALLGVLSIILGVLRQSMVPRAK